MRTRRPREVQTLYRVSQLQSPDACLWGPALIYQAILPYPPHFLHAPCCRVDLSSWASLMAQQVKNPPQCRRCRRHWFGPWVGNIPWRRKWRPTPILLSEKPHGQRSLAGYSSQVTKGRTPLSTAQRHGTFRTTKSWHPSCRVVPSSFISFT